MASIQGTSAHDTLAGTAESDNIQGLGGNDTLLGGAGNDTLDGGADNDRLEGGAGNDTYVVDSLGDSVVEALNAGTDLVNVALASGGYDLSPNVENATVATSAGLGLMGNALNNVLTGNDGNDTFSGGLGADTLIGGAGNDRLDGGAGVDRLVGGVGDDEYYVDAPTDVIVEDAGAGSDYVSVNFTATGTYVLAANVEDAEVESSASVAVNLTGNASDNRLQGHEGKNVLNGGLGDDTLEGNGGADTVDGGAGTDTLELQGNRNEYTVSRTTTDLVLTRGTEIVTFRNVESIAFADTLVGEQDLRSVAAGDTADNIVGTAGADNFDGKGGNDTLSGLEGNDTLAGGMGDDKLYGGDDNDTLAGGAGNDTLDGGLGNDALDGGAGNDTYVIDSLSDQVVEALNAGTDTVNIAFASGPYTLADNVENATVTFSSGFGLLTGNGLNNLLVGNAGEDILVGGAGADVLVGGAGRDALGGDDGNDTLFGGEGNDRLRGGAGIDRLVGGSGSDYYWIDSTDVVVEEAGADQIDQLQVYFSASGTYTMSPNVETADIDASLELKTNLTGNASSNRLLGSAGDNVLIGAGGDDTLHGHFGNDTLDGGAGSDLVMLFGVQSDYTVARISATDIRLLNDATGEIKIIRGVENFRFQGDSDKTLSEVVSNSASEGADTVNGSSSHNMIDGLAGNDVLNGLAGDDTLTGGAGNDTLDGGLGNDALDGGAGNDTYVIDSLSDQVVEALNAGTDTVNIAFASGPYTLADNVENATVTLSGDFSLTGNALNNVLTGNDGKDTLSGGSGNDTLTGNAGDDELDGGAGTDRLAGGTGDDIYTVDVATDVVVEGTDASLDTVKVAFTAAGTYILATNVENGLIASAPSLKVNLTGNAGNNALIGNTGDNVITGASGDDTLVGGGGNDTLDGGVGAADMAVFDGVLADYAVARLSATDIRFTHIGSGAITIVRGVEWFHFQGGGPDKTLSEVVSNTASAGADTVNGSSGDDIIDGLAGNDVLNGLGGNDTLIGGLGDDRLDGGSDADRMEGGAGNDTYTVDSLGDQVVEALNAGTDLVNVALLTGAYDLSPNVENATVTTSAGLGLMGNGLNNVLTGNDGEDTLSGGLGADTLSGGAGNDLLDGGAGADRMTGGTGNDTYVIDVASDIVVEGADPGVDLVQVAFASTGTYLLGANVENAIVLSSGAVNLTGNGGTNLLTGGAGNNVLNGMAGNDTLAGGLGSDTLTGGLGADTFLFDSAITLSNADRITDFSSAQGDKIQLSASVFSALGVAGGAVTLDGVTLAYNAVTGALTYDADGAGGSAAITIVTLGTTTHPALTSGDFLALA